MNSRSEHQMNFLDLLGRMNQEKAMSFYCQDSFDSEVSSEEQHYNQARTFLLTAREDAGENRPDGSDYVLLALIGKDMLARSSQYELATVMTGITLAFRSLTPIEVDEAGTSYRIPLNWSIYNMRNKLLMDWFHSRGIWALVNNKQAATDQYDKIHSIRKVLEFRVGDPPRHDIYLLKTANLTKYAPGHYILLINKYCFHLINVWIFSGEYQRMKARLFGSITSFDRVGSTQMDVVVIDFTCKTMAVQSHSLFFNNCQNFATNVYGVICEEKGVKVELPSFSGATVIIQVLLIILLGLLMFIVMKLAY